MNNLITNYMSMDQSGQQSHNQLIDQSIHHLSLRDQGLEEERNEEFNMGEQEDQQKRGSEKGIDKENNQSIEQEQQQWKRRKKKKKYKNMVDQCMGYGRTTQLIQSEQTAMVKDSNKLTLDEGMEDQYENRITSIKTLSQKLQEPQKQQCPLSPQFKQRISYKQDSAQQLLELQSTSQQDRTPLQQVNTQSSQQQSKASSLITIHKTFLAKNITDLLFARLPQQSTLQFLINTNNQFFSTKTSYDLFLKNQKRYLVTAIKDKFSIRSKYLFKRLCTKQPSVLAILQSNYFGLQYRLRTAYNQHPLQLIYIKYEANSITPKQISVTQNRRPYRLPIHNKFSQIKEAISIPQHKIGQFPKFYNRKPIKNKKGHYQLEYEGVAKLPSCNNLIIEDNKGQTLMIMGRISGDTFQMKIKCRSECMSIAQAFSIGISNLDSKLLVR